MAPALPERGSWRIRSCLVVRRSSSGSEIGLSRSGRLVPSRAPADAAGKANRAVLTFVTLVRTCSGCPAVHATSTSGQAADGTQPHSTVLVRSWIRSPHLRKSGRRPKRVFLAGRSQRFKSSSAHHDLSPTTIVLASEGLRSDLARSVATATKVVVNVRRVSSRVHK